MKKYQICQTINCYGAPIFNPDTFANYDINEAHRRINDLRYGIAICTLGEGKCRAEYEIREVEV